MTAKAEVSGERFDVFAQGLLALMQKKNLTLNEALATSIAEARAVGSDEEIPALRAGAELIRGEKPPVKTPDSGTVKI